jgi:hypothetical protein
MLDKIKEMLIKTITYSVIAGILGGLLSFLFKWPLYKGVYMGILMPGLGIIFYASMNFIGLPSERRDFFTGKMNLENKENPDKKNKTLGDGGWAPAFVGVLMIAIALLIEAIFHGL